MISDQGPMEFQDQWKYLTFLCEGPNDAVLIRRIGRIFDPAVLRIRIKPQEGIDSLILSLDKNLNKYISRGPVIALYDEGDMKPGYMERLEETARKFPDFMSCPVTRKIEAWLMADLKALNRSTGLDYNGPLPTDRIEDPKKFFLHFFRVAVRQGKRNFLTRETDFFRAVARRWHGEIARINNESLDRALSLMEFRLSFMLKKEESA